MSKAETYKQEYLALTIDRDGDTEEEKQRWNALHRACVSGMSDAAFRHAFGQFACEPPLGINEASLINGKTRRSVLRAAAELKQFLDAGIAEPVTLDVPTPDQTAPRELSADVLPPWGEWLEQPSVIQPQIDEASLIQAVQTVLERWGEYKRDPIPFHLRAAVYERDGYACIECGRETHLTVDHCIAVTSGGTTIAENLRTLCRPCNSRKGAKNVRPVS